MPKVDKKTRNHIGTYIKKKWVGSSQYIESNISCHQ